MAELKDPLRISLGNLQEGVVILRPNRFVAVVRTSEEEVLAHIADSGRLKELIYPGNRVMVRQAADREQGLRVTVINPETGRTAASLTRKTSYDMVLAAAPALRGTAKPDDGALHEIVAGRVAENRITWVSVDTRYPTRLFGQALCAGAVPEFSRYASVRPEYPFHRVEEEWRRREGEVRAGASETAPEPPKSKTPRSRLDFYLEGNGVSPALVEVKSVTLCADGLGLFPDAPTDRGARHLGELGKAVAMGYEAYAVFIAQREDICSVSPNSATDPEFARSLRDAKRRGVHLLAYRCRVSVDAITLEPRALPIIV